MTTEDEIIEALMKLSPSELDQLLDSLDDNERATLLELIERQTGGSSSGRSSSRGGSGGSSSRGGSSSSYGSSRGGSDRSSSRGGRTKAEVARDEACEYLDRAGLKYSITSQGNIALTFTKNHKDDITVFVAVHEDYDIHMRTSDLVEFSPRQRDRAYQIMSDLNTKYRYAKFCMDTDDTIHAEADLPGHSDGGNCFDVLAEFIKRIEHIARDSMNDELWRIAK